MQRHPCLPKWLLSFIVPISSNAPLLRDMSVCKMTRKAFVLLVSHSATFFFHLPHPALSSSVHSLCTTVTKTPFNLFIPFSNNVFSART